ncbi:MAG TPA: ATP-binding protein [Candidatus Saccharimonadaceae bacterium]|nr:ATP-binding protein [Candidatus Saccharimonadaceae bacterium]
MSHSIVRFFQRHRPRLLEAVARELTPSFGAERAGEEAEALMGRLERALPDVWGVVESAHESVRGWMAQGLPASRAGRAVAALLLPGESLDDAAAPEVESVLVPLMEAVPSPLLLVDRELRIRLGNRAASALFARPASALTGTALVDWLVPATREGIARQLREGPSGLRLVRARLAHAPDEELLCSRIEFAHAGFAGWFVTLRPNPASAIADDELSDLLRREMAQKEKFAALLTVSHAIVHSLELKTVLTTIAQQVRQVIQTDECTVFLLDESDMLLKPAVCEVENYYEEMMACRLKVGEGITGTVALTGRGEIVNDAENDPRAITIPNTPPVELSSLMCVPLVLRGRVLGVLTMLRYGARYFVDDDLELATLFAGLCSAAIENARLFEQTKHAYDELSETQAQLVQSAKLNALGEMAGGVAHDFNNVLAAILGRTQLLLKNVKDPETRRQLRIIEQAAHDGAHTVRRVQEFTRVRQDERFATLDVNDVLVGVLELTRTAWEAGAKRRGVSVDVDVDLKAARPVAGNASELREVFTNLVLNAVDAMPWGGRLSVSSESDDRDVTVRFRDNGVGMDAATCGKIFDPFFTTKEVKGTGLGLSVAYGIVTRHRGTIAVESQPNLGTEFVVRFPVGQAQESNTGDADAGPLPRLHALVVDDEEPVLSVLADLLRALGQDVQVALGGAAGLDAFIHGGFDIVFTDLGMPEVNGWDLALGVKSQRPLVPVVLVTGWGYQLEGSTAHAHGVDFVMPKPFSLADVERVLRQAADAAPQRAA